MIEIKSLNKIYKSKRRKKCHALRDVNLTLPDTGLVFVLGKSGSGKSTLLNLIGGLDNITSGSVEVDGNDLAKFREKDFCNYRNSHIGFIFQDYHLIDELTVFENIHLSLDLKNMKQSSLVKEALARVDLAGYGDRFPSELSGGEQQRVAIARALVKKPRIILADEPTGNLDTNTATAIITLLKELSKECLILIVSHNVNDANNYADRIIELKKGEIISDRSRNPEFLDEVTLAGEELIYPNGLALSDTDIDLMNRNKEATIVKKRDKFLPTVPPRPNGRRVKIQNKNLTSAREIKLSGEFLKSKVFAIAASSVMVAVIMVIMALAQTIIVFDGGAVVADEMGRSRQSSLFMSKTLDDETKIALGKSYRVKVDDADVKAFYDGGYKGKIYPVLNYSLYTSSNSTFYGMGSTNLTKGVLLGAGLGTIIADDALLREKFGDFELTAKADVITDYGIYITDYAADSFISLNSSWRGKDYSDLVGEVRVWKNYPARFYINGVIKTGYKEKYEELFEEAEKNNLNAAELHENKQYEEFFYDVYDRLGYSYTTCENFAEEYWSTGVMLHPGHYKLSFNNLADYFSAAKQPLVLGIDFVSSIKNASNYIAGDWMYTTKTPEIPEGAKYIRVAFNTGIEKAYKIEHEVAAQKYAVLCFDGERVPKEQMNFSKAVQTEIANNLALTLDPYNGTEVPKSAGAYSAAYISDYIEIPEGAEITEFSSIALVGTAHCVFYDENMNYISAVGAWYGGELPESTVIMNYEVYNSIFGTEYDLATRSVFIPHKVTLSHYEYSDTKNENPLFTKEITIAGLTNQGVTMYASPDVMELFQKDFIRTQALYFNGSDGIGSVLDLAETMNYEPQSYALEGVHTMTRVVEVFVPIFELIAIILCLGVVFILVNFSSKMINDKMHEIGILKALGTKNAAIGVIFGLQVGLIAILTCILATAGYHFFIGVANDILIESLKRFSSAKVVLDLDFLSYSPEIAKTNCNLVCILALSSLVFPMIKIKAIKPVKIIKAKD